MWNFSGICEDSMRSNFFFKLKNNVNVSGRYIKYNVFVCVRTHARTRGAHMPVFFLIIFSIAQKHSMTLRKNFERSQEMYISLLNYSEPDRLFQNFLSDYFKSRHFYLKSESQIQAHLSEIRRYILSL